MARTAEEAIESILSTSLARVLDFLRYAEAKNGALLTFSSAWILALTALVISDKTAPQEIISASKIALPLFGVGVAISMFSFFPKLSLERFTRLHSVRHEPNLVYFDDVANLPLDDYEKQLRHRYTPTAGSHVSHDYLSDLAIQVRVNSWIVRRKLRLFARALLAVGLGITIVFIPLMVSAIKGLQGLLWV
jgi:hypothetical protein